MKKLVIALLSLGGLSGCVSSGTLLPKTQLEIEFLSGQGIEPYYIIKNNAQLQRACKKKDTYISWTGSCGFGGNPPETLTFQATPWINRQEFNQLLHQGKDAKLLQHNYAQSLPQSAWRTYTINPKQLLEKGKTMPAKGMPASHWHKTRVVVTLYIDGNGNVSQEIEHKPVSVGSGV